MSRPIGISTGSPCALVLLGLLFVGCWSSGFVGAKLAAEHAAVPTTLMWRFWLVLAVLLPLVGLARWARPAPPGAERAGWDGPALARHLLIGLLSQVGYLVTVYGAIQLGVSTGTTALIDGVQPLVAAALVGPLLGAAVSGRQWLGMLVGLAGVLLVTWADATAPATSAPLWAYLLPLLGMLSLVASTFVERRTRLAAPRLEVLTVHCAVSAVVFTGVAVATGVALPPAAAGFWVAQAGLAVLATFGGYGLYWLLVARIGVAPVNSLMFLIPPVTAVWGALMFGEPFTVVTGVGLGLALVAATTVTGGPSRGARTPSGGRRIDPRDAELGVRVRG